MARRRQSISITPRSRIVLLLLIVVYGHKCRERAFIACLLGEYTSTGNVQRAQILIFDLFLAIGYRSVKHEAFSGQGILAPLSAKDRGLSAK